MLSASLSVLSSVPLTQRPSISLPDDEADEDDSLHGDVQPSIGWRSPISLANRRAKQKPAALSALLGISAGLGALLAVFLFLRIPACVPSHSEDGEATKHGLRIAFYTVGVLALVNALIALVALPGRSALGRIVAEETTFLGYIKYELGQILKGFKLARKNVQIALACAGGFAARAQTIAVS